MKFINNLISYLSIYGLFWTIPGAHSGEKLMGIDARMGINVNTISVTSKHSSDLRDKASLQSAKIGTASGPITISSMATAELAMLGIDTGGPSFLLESGLKLDYINSEKSPLQENPEISLVTTKLDTTEQLELLDINVGTKPLTLDLGLKLREDDTVSVSPMDRPEILLAVASPDTTGRQELLDINVGTRPLTPDLGLKLRADDTVSVPHTGEPQMWLAGTTTTDGSASRTPKRLEREEYIGGEGLSLGPGELEPQLELKLRYDDNLTFTEEEPTGAFVTLIKPRVAYNIIGNTKEYKLEYEINAAFHEGSRIDNYVNNRINTSFDYNPTSRIYSQVAGEFKESVDGRGRGQAEGGQGTVQTSPDEWHQWKFTSKFAYGAQTAKGRIELESDYALKRYDSNLETTFGRNLDQMGLKGRFFYRVRPKTSLLLEASRSEFNYQSDVPGEPSLDSTNLHLFGGVTWFATFKTTGFFKLGYIRKNFDSSRRAANDGLSWDIGLDWNRKTYSTVHFDTSQSFTETDGSGDAVNRIQTNLGWEHFWLRRLSTNLKLSYIQESFNPDNREDNVFVAGARLNYEFRRWLKLGASYSFHKRQSSDVIFGYEQNIFEITANFIL